MAFNNPDMPWSEVEALLSGRKPSDPAAASGGQGGRGKNGREPGSPSWNAGGDGPAWTRKRQPYVPPSGSSGSGDADVTRPLLRPDAPYTPYAELHCHSNFSFLDGASHPEQLAEEANRLGLEALAITDHNGFYGVVRFAEAARAVGLPTVFGTEITLTADGGAGAGAAATQRRLSRSEADTQVQQRVTTQTELHAPDPHGEHLLLLADGPTGYARLARALSLGHLAGEKGAPQFTMADIADTCSGHAWVLTGCRKGTVPAALVRDGPAAAARQLRRLIDAFGRERVVVELWDHGNPLDSARNDALAELAARHDVACVATNNVHYATPSQRQLASAVAAAVSTISTRGCRPLPAPICAAVPNRRGGSCVIPVSSS
jgi:error-prone DNA polymerase